MKYRILIIDDQYNRRKKRYLKLFSESEVEFEVIPTIRLDEIREVAPKAHLSIVDIMLDDPDHPLFLSGVDIIDFLNTHNESLPIYLISGKWSDIELKTYFKRFLQSKIVGGANYDMLTQSSERGRVLFEIVTQIKKNQNQINLNIGHDEDLIILHLSDLQFGGNWEGIGDTESEKYRNVMNNILKSFPVHDSGEKLKPNILFITGDIAQTAHPQEYEMALTNLDYLCSELEISKERRFIVPGNHDLSLSLFFSKVLQYDFDKKELSYGANDEYYESFALEPFKRFSYLFSGRHDWEIILNSKDSPDENAHFLSTAFSHYGINLIGISTVSNATSDNPTSPKLSISSINKIREVLTQKVSENAEIVNLFLLHHSPWKDLDDSLGHDGDAFLSGIEGLSESLIAFGHKHKGAVNLRSYNEDSKKNVVFSIAPTPSLIKRHADTLRGFNIIRLHRVDDSVHSCTIEKYEYSGSNYHMTEKSKFERDSNKGWDAVFD